MSGAYYNEIDPYAAEWLRNLIKAGHIAPGDVDERSIEDVHPGDIRKYTQCHFFAGIGVWSHALRRAGVPDTQPVWTGSCPCQPFSAAGEGKGMADERHLWPAFHYLIEQCRPSRVYGEQVASKDADPWIDLVQTDLEALGYGVGAIAFPSAGIGAPHIRDRLYWVADANSREFDGVAILRGTEFHRENTGRQKGISQPKPCGDIRGMAHADVPVAEQFAWQRARPSEASGAGAHDQSDGRGQLAQEQSDASPTNGFWRASDWLLCRDGKWRPVEPGTFPLANGAAGRVGRLRAYGNAINAEAATVFIRSVMEVA
jgi:DNA (cytosine-5)-methyltransferase 1